MSDNVVDSQRAGRGRSGAMWQALGGLLPIAVAVAISFRAYTVTILILLSPNRNRAALPFLVGWVIGVAAVIILSALGASALPKPPRRGPDTTTAVLLMAVGTALIVLGIVHLRRGSRSESTGPPRLLSRVDSFGAWFPLRLLYCSTFDRRACSSGWPRACPARSFWKAGEAGVLIAYLHSDRDVDRRSTDRRLVHRATSGGAEAHCGPRLAGPQWPDPDVIDDVMIGVVILGAGLTYL